MVEKKEMFEAGLIKLDFLGKEDDVFNKAIDELDKKLLKDAKELDAQQMAGVLADKARNSKN